MALAKPFIFPCLSDRPHPQDRPTLSRVFECICESFFKMIDCQPEEHFKEPLSSTNRNYEISDYQINKGEYID